MKRHNLSLKILLKREEEEREEEEEEEISLDPYILLRPSRYFVPPEVKSITLNVSQWTLGRLLRAKNTLSMNYVGERPIFDRTPFYTYRFRFRPCARFVGRFAPRV